MERKQIYLASEQIEELEEIAYQRKVPVSVVIRDAVALYIVDQGGAGLKSAEEHPLWDLVGMLDGPEMPTDGSVNHDRVLYDRNP